MNKVILFSDSCSSFTKEQTENLNIKIVPTLFELDGITYNPLDENIFDYEEYYAKLENKASVKTSCINPQSFQESFTPYLQQGYDIVCFTLSSGLSASHNNAVIAANLLKEQFPNNVVEIVDSKTGSIGMQIAIREAVVMRDAGKSATEIKNALDDNALNVQSYFTIGSLDHLRRGGRLSKFSAIIGSVLKIAPVITTNIEGKLVEFGKFIGRRKAISALKQLIIDKANKIKTIFIGHTNCKEEADQLKGELEQKGFEIFSGYIDYTMGAHCGPKTLAIFYR